MTLESGNTKRTKEYEGARKSHQKWIGMKGDGDIRILWNGPVDSSVDAEDSRLLGQALSRRIIGCAIEVHRTLGPGLLESAYRTCLLRELELAEIGAESEVPVSMDYRGARVACAYRADIIVEGKVLLELKAVERLLPEHEAQVLTYMKLSKVRLGLLMNFHASMLRQGLRRFVL